jgi:hypothetical protein
MLPSGAGTTPATETPVPDTLTFAGTRRSKAEPVSTREEEADDHQNREADGHEDRLGAIGAASVPIGPAPAQVAQFVFDGLRLALRLVGRDDLVRREPDLTGVRTQVRADEEAARDVRHVAPLDGIENRDRDVRSARDIAGRQASFRAGLAQPSSNHHDNSS